MTRSYDEVETKYDVDETFVLPPLADLLSGLAPRWEIAEDGVDEWALEATYFDTADLRLFHAGLTLRRRTGGPDDGWHLKVPIGGGARREVRAALGRSARTAPLRLRRMVWVHTRGEPLVPVLQISNQRSEHHLVDVAAEDRTALADLAEDRVIATRLLLPEGDDARTLAWREIEVELVGGDPALLELIERPLGRLGAERSASSSKLARGLGRHPDLDRTGRALKRRRRRLSRSSGAGEVIVTYLARELHRVRNQDLPVRIDLPDSLHSMRVSTRRLRSGLHTFAPLFEAERIEPLERELKWLADELGRARDAEVLRMRLAAAIEGEQARHLSTGRVGQTVDRDMVHRQRAAFADVVDALDSERYRLLVSALEEFVADPPLTAAGGRAARKQLRNQVRKSYDEVRQAVLASDGLPSGDERDDQLHTARKAAKRARYAAEAVTPAFGQHAKAFAAAMEQLQSVLGERHDSVVMQARLHELALEATPPAAFTYGRLHARESAHQDAVDASVAKTWRAAARKSLRTWLT